MFKTKRFLGVIIIAIFLLLNLSTICYADTLEIDVNGVKMQVDYTAPTLDENEIAEIKEIVEIYVEAREISDEVELKAEVLNEVIEKVEELIEEKEKEKARLAEKTVLKEMEKEYRAEKNKIPKAGDLTILVLKNITIVSVIVLIVVLVWNRKIKK